MHLFFFIKDLKLWTSAKQEALKIKFFFSWVFIWKIALLFLVGEIVLQSPFYNLKTCFMKNDSFHP